MKDQFFTDQQKYAIPSLNLMHRDQPVAFAYRTTEYIWDRTNGQADVPHRHNFYTILWVQQACGKHFIDYREYDIAPNTVFFVSPGQVHQVITHFRPVGVVLMFTSDFLIQHHISDDFIVNLGLFADHADVPPLHITSEVADQLQLIVSQIERVFDSGQPYTDEAIAAWIRLFLIECNRLAIPDGDTNPQSLQSGRSLVRRFKQLLEQHFSEWHKVGDYAEAMSITPDYLNSVLKSAIGTNAKDYIQNRIVLEARRLGVHTQLSSKEIAFQLGFDDPAHFSKFYKNITGTSFSDFRATLLV